MAAGAGLILAMLDHLVANRRSLFSDALASYFWEYDNTGLKLAQLRFYEVATTVAAP